MLSAVADSWKALGSCLGLSHTTLKAIAKDSQSSDLCLKQVLSLWLNTPPSPTCTFEVLVEALRQIGHHRIAFEVRKMSGITGIFRGKSARLSNIIYLRVTIKYGY